MTDHHTITDRDTQPGTLTDARASLPGRVDTGRVDTNAKRRWMPDQARHDEPRCFDIPIARPHTRHPGLDPGSTFLTSGSNPKSSARSRHSALSFSTSATFHSRRQFLSCFSRPIACSIEP